ncbi:MAG TPA: hypothetical protein VNB29_11035, partial [Chthoniobacterales bacterium]|nr:hypothetical protein [Chthoniobacterales bacterium]
MNSAGSEDGAFTLAWDDGKSQPFEIAPGQGHSVAVPDAARSHVAVLGGDPFEFDNRAWFAPVTAVAITIDYFGAAKPDDTTDSLFFLSRALNSSPEFKIDLRVNPSQTTIRPTFTIVDGPLDPSASLELRKQLESGGQALLVLRDTGAPLAAIIGGQPAISEASVDGWALFGEISFSDPVFQPFSDPKYSNFSHIYSWHYRKLDPAQIPGARTLAAFDSGDPALLRVPIGRGALFVLTSSWRPADSQLALSSKFVPLLHSLIAQSSGATQAETNVSIGDVVPLPSQADTQVITPSGASVPASGGKFTATDTPGLYHTADQRFTFAVNPRISESELTPLSDPELRALGLPLEKIDPSAANETVRRAMAQEEIERRQKWWWWLILAAITALIVESALAAWFSQKRTQAAPA